MHVRVVSVQKTTVTYHQIKDRVAVAIGVMRIASEDIKDLPPIVLTPGKLTIAVVIRLTARISQGFEFVPFGMVNQPEIGIGIAPWLIEVLTNVLQALFEPVWKWNSLSLRLSRSIS